MKKKMIKKTVKAKNTPKCKSWLWIIVAFVLGGIIGYTTHYLIINWNRLFEPSSCESIEHILSKKLAIYGKKSMRVGEHIERAKIYTNLSESGCEVHMSNYANLAKNEMDIINILKDGNLDDEHEAIEIIELYDRLQMLTEAEKMVEKSKKTAGLSINFIIKLEKIIEKAKKMLCDDGNRPDKNGCCAGEVYTDAGGGWMVCCPDGGNNCFPPMK